MWDCGIVLFGMFFGPIFFQKTGHMEGSPHCSLGHFIQSMAGATGFGLTHFIQICGD